MIVMNLPAIWHQQILRITFWIKMPWIKMAILVFLIAVGWSMPAQAAVSAKTEAEVLQIIRKHPEVILESILSYQDQQQQKQEQSRRELLENFKNNPDAFIGESPKTQNVKQKIVLVEFSDFQCPFCGEANKTVNQFMKAHQEEVTLVYKHFPLTQIHPEAIPAAKAAWAANQQGKFWQYHDKLFAQQDNLGDKLYINIANKLNLDIEKFNQDRYGDAAELAIKQDVEIAEKLGVQGTPFFVMDGRVFEGAVPLSVLESAF
jgi:protein-disulfide isomerase